jgi:hypothetical protein
LLKPGRRDSRPSTPDHEPSNSAITRVPETASASINLLSTSMPHLNNHFPIHFQIVKLMLWKNSSCEGFLANHPLSGKPSDVLRLRYPGYKIMICSMVRSSMDELVSTRGIWYAVRLRKVLRFFPFLFIAYFRIFLFFEAECISLWFFLCYCL